MRKIVVSMCVVLGLGSACARAAGADCLATSSRMLAHLDQGDYAGATADFNGRMKAALGADKLARIWPAIEQQFGARGAHEQARPGEVKGYAVVVTPLHYGQHLVDARVVCDSDGKVAGFFIKPHP